MKRKEAHGEQVEEERFRSQWLNGFPLGELDGEEGGHARVSWKSEALGVGSARTKKMVSLIYKL